MRRWILRVSFLIIISLLVWWSVTGLHKQILYQTDGVYVIADAVWQIGDKVFYQNGTTVAWVASSKVEGITGGSLTDPSLYSLLLSAHFQNTLKWLGGPVAPEAGWMALLSAIAKKVGTHPAKGIGVIFFCFLSYVGFKRIRKFFGNKTETATQNKYRLAGYLPHLAGFTDVALLFLDLYREAIGAAPDAPVEINPVSKADSGSKNVFELRIEHEGNRLTRRMTISAIGENTGSKSQCFYVIFDTHMVVKIPPKPINDFEIYLEKLQAEAKISRVLEPKECVIPNLSVILKKIHAFPDADKLTAEQLEARYIQWLRKYPGNQRFLKVGGNFAFFMDLARHYFMSHVARGFHNTEDLISGEVHADTDTFTDLNAFESKYGNAGNELWSGLHGAYLNFQREISGALALSHEAVDLSEWQIKNWFLYRMAGREAQLSDLKVSSRFKTDLENRFQKFTAGQTEIGRRYRQILASHTEVRLFNRNRPFMEAMATNLLALLDGLAEKRVAMRDLKPDNLLVAGNPANYPQFLSAARHYTIGLIDLETAIEYETGSRKAPPQPQLCGTPFYGTPSHFFANDLLAQVHGALAPVFHLQDWYAIVGVIYEVITAEKLFQRSAREIVKLIKVLEGKKVKKGDLKSTYARLAGLFWETSASELRRNLRRNSLRLEAVTIGIPENIRRRLTDHLRAAQTMAEKRVVRCLNTNPAFNKGKNRALLEKSAVRDLERIRDKYKGGSAQALVCRMDELIEYKRTAQHLADLSKMLQAPFAKVSARVLLQLMFDVVSGCMRPDIAAAVSEKSPASTAASSDASNAEDIPLETEAPVVGLGFSVTVEAEAP